MCGIVGIAAAGGAPLSVPEREFLAMRDAMVHRGPDAAGLWTDGVAMLGHRRLSVMDPTEAGHQPMHTPPDMRTGRSRYSIVYNGELYNDAELRAELGARGVRFTSSCDTETVLHAFATWGVEAFWRARGMFAIAVYDAELRTLTLARDPMGIKPLYFAAAGREFVFASEPGVVAMHPGVGRRPNRRMVSAYLTTIRTVLGEETLFEGVRALRPGHLLQCDLSGPTPAVRVIDWWRGPECDPEGSRALDDTAGLVRTTLADSVSRHMRSDVPICSLLSGGLDSTAIVSEAIQHHDALRTYAAGHETGEEGDLHYARLAAAAFETDHAEAVVDEEHFRKLWPEMIAAQSAPLSTPNEVAIYTVAKRLRADGCVVTLSGEGADELFGGYERPLLAATRYIAGEHTLEGPGAFELAANAWLPTEAKQTLFTEEYWDSIAADMWLSAWYEDEFQAAARECGADDPESEVHPLQPHLRFLRRHNLTGLLQRLDTATMLASVEGRTPFADASMAMLAERLPMNLKFTPPAGVEAAALAEAGVVGTSRTKIALREAYRTSLPEYVVAREKASFPLPFHQWLGGHGDAVRGSALLREVFVPEVIEVIASQPESIWNVAWPAINLAYWGRVFE